MKKRWSPVTRTMWTDDRFLSLTGPTPNAQTLWIYLLTNPHQIAIPGLMPLGAGAIADGLDWKRRDVEALLGELEEAGMIQICHRPALIFLPNSINHNQPANPNQIKGWRNGFDNLPDTPLRGLALLVLREGLRTSLLGTFDRVFADALDRANTEFARNQERSRNGLGNGTGNQEQEQEYIVRGQNRYKSDAQKASEKRAKKKVERKVIKGEALRLAQVLRDAIGTHSADYVETKIDDKRVEAWAEVVDKMLRLDKADPFEVEAVITWAHVDDKTGFWRPNLLSPNSLRKQFPRLKIQAKRAGKLERFEDADGWKKVHGGWAIRLAERYFVMNGIPVSGAALIEEAKLQGVPTLKLPEAEKVASWAVERA